MKKAITVLVAVLCIMTVSFSASAESKAYPGDQMIYLTQRWLNEQYGEVEGFGKVEENGKTGWDTVSGLLRALQHELGINALANSFGPTTTSLYKENLLRRQDGVKDRKFAILQGALWCKGYNPGYNIYEENGKVVFNAVFDENVEKAVINLKKDAGLTEPDGVVTLNVMKALLSMDSFKLLGSYGGKESIREMQQELNRKYENYTGLNPCDGIYGRNTNKALIFALQALEGLPVDVANGNFGVTTKLCCPEIPYLSEGDSAKQYPGTEQSAYYSTEQINSFTRLLQYALLVNGFDTGEVDGVFDSVLESGVRDFQKKHALDVTGKADKSTWMSLLKSSGDTSRPALGADCATILTEAKAETLYDNGYRYIGRYLTGTYNSGISKAITRQEAEIILSAGMNFFPIYQTSARTASYFTVSQGEADAKAAIKAAVELGVPDNTIIYFAVDFDVMDAQVTSVILPYFNKVSQVMKQGPFRTGIYGVRNACIRAAEAGYTCSSFVCDMSTGYSGNLGYPIPDNWAFDQFATVSLGSGDGYIEIDKNAFSGRDYGVSRLEPPHSHSYTSQITKAATCTDEGVMTFTCKCGEGYTRTIEKTNHRGGTANCKDKAVCTLCKQPYGAVNGKNHKSIISLPSKTPTYKLTGLTAGKKCSACNTVTVKQNRIPVKKLSAPTNLRATFYTKNLKLTWNKVTGAEKYEIIYVGGGKTVTKTVTANSIRLTSLKTATTYTVKVRAVAGTNKSAQSTVTASTKPSTAKIKSLKSSKKKVAVASWGKVSGATKYEVQYSTSKKFTKKTAKTTKSVRLTIKKLKSKKKYYVRVRAYKVVGGKKICGSWSSVKSVRVK